MLKRWYACMLHSYYFGHFSLSEIRSVPACQSTPTGPKPRPESYDSDTLTAKTFTPTVKVVLSLMPHPLQLHFRRHAHATAAAAITSKLPTARSDATRYSTPASASIPPARPRAAGAVMRHRRRVVLMRHHRRVCCGDFADEVVREAQVLFHSVTSIRTGDRLLRTLNVI